MHFDTVITAVINFLIIAAVVYFAFVVPIQRIMGRYKTAEEKTEEKAEAEVELLGEIRDLLREQRSGSGR